MEAPTSFWLGRQPILDRSSSTVGYELLFRSGDANRASFMDGRTATARVISHAFGELGLTEVLGECRGFVNFGADLLLSEAVELLPPERTVVEILETASITPELIERCRELRNRGFSFALDDIVRIEQAHAPLLPLVDIVKVDVRDISAEDLRALVASVRAGSRAKLLAEKVDSRDQAALCHRLGFDLFQGYFFARPTIIQGRRADPSKQHLLRLLQETLDEDGDNAAIVRIFKETPELSYKLMRLVNSVSIGARAPIESLSHALKILGRRQLQRWLQILLFAQHGSGVVRSPLLELAAARGKLMELLAERHASDRTLADRAFMTGILSLLDALLDLPLEDVIAPLRLSDDVRSALLERGGQLGHLLQIVEALERSDDASIVELGAARSAWPLEGLLELQISALSWSTALGRSGD